MQEGPRHFRASVPEPSSTGIQGKPARSAATRGPRALDFLGSRGLAASGRGLGTGAGRRLAEHPQRDVGHFAGGHLPDLVGQLHCVDDLGVRESRPLGSLSVRNATATPPIPTDTSAGKMPTL